jgi:hypothetical protein
MFRYATFFITAILAISCGSNHMLKETKIISSYPSASGIEYFNKQYFVIGDDANHLLILDSNLNPVDSLQLYSFPGKRISKADKPDLEAMTVTSNKKLLIVGSGSISPQRNKGWLIDPVSKQKDSIQLDVFYQRLKESGLAELNIEGICAVPGGMILSNRGSKGYPKNHLLFTSAAFWEQQSSSPIHIMSIGGNTDTAFFSGVSGIAYSKKSDRLVLTVSTEDTRNTIDDGVIGKSYLWIIDDISSKRQKGWKAINPDQVIDLGAIDPKFNGQKIESVCVTKETKNFLHLVLAADNDDGSSTIFRLITEKK